MHWGSAYLPSSFDRTSPCENEMMNMFTGLRLFAIQTRVQQLYVISIFQFLSADGWSLRTPPWENPGSIVQCHLSKESLKEENCARGWAEQSAAAYGCDAQRDLSMRQTARADLWLLIWWDIISGYDWGTDCTRCRRQQDTPARLATASMCDVYRPCDRLRRRSLRLIYISCRVPKIT